ncbi:non-specific lipid transfer protein GPI-anchored 12-like isoform X2 [Oryza brachyantha]|uniref:non-specific lipid transfer protein GPI-anchored 12-like isoform X2 n=1 Tax=Oryza brachyantha TaxID=4533 RepID=UPI001AD96BE7|nr:non-specific lipid transfer protein GPI-anchored 12-like isoform X2 [Oryza brachyantha]
MVHYTSQLLSAHAHAHAHPRSPRLHMSKRRSRSTRIDAMAMIMPPMASAGAVAALLVLTSLLQPRAARAQIAAAPWAAPPPWPGELDCTGALLNLSSCLTYVEARSALTRPEKGCCGALAGVVDGEAACLCGLVGGYGAYGVRVDAVRALALPTICRVDAPPPRLCAALGVPVAEPPGGAFPTESGPSGMPANAPSTAASGIGGAGGPATHRPTRHHLLLPLLVIPATLLLLLLQQ